mmetsp:Transcript_21324/g.35160  ORF Transcript_21324/g.35160 Transcript_21324/m.35160 type:complete len:102 (+) Transcript_21324:311-616(+)
MSLAKGKSIGLTKDNSSDVASAKFYDHAWISLSERKASGPSDDAPPPLLCTDQEEIHGVSKLIGKWCGDRNSYKVNCREGRNLSTRTVRGQLISSRHMTWN